MPETGFLLERAVLQPLLGSVVDGGIHHIGSTAVPGLASKPIIDVMVGVRGLDGARHCFDALARIGYSHWPYSPSQHWFCKPLPSERTHRLHLINPAHPQFAARLAFRNYLRAHPDTAVAYAALKVELATRYRSDREAYTEAKGAFVGCFVGRAQGRPIR